MTREHGPDCPCPSRQHHPDRYGPDGGMRHVADPGGPDCMVPVGLLDALRARPAERCALGGEMRRTEPVTVHRDTCTVTLPGPDSRPVEFKRQDAARTT